MRDGNSLEKKNTVWFLAGLVAVLLTVVPTLLLGEDAIFTAHDQLDGEVIAFCLQAKHLFDGDVLPEFLGGAFKTALTMPAPAFVLLFFTGDAYLGLVIMLLCGRIAGYVGMYLLSREITGDAPVSAVVGVLFGWLPFLPVYGLSQFGIPMLIWCALRLKSGKNKGFAFGYTAIFALTSSLVLVGYGLLGMGLVFVIWCFAKKREAALRMTAAWALLLGVYVVENLRLLGGLLGLGEDFVSHKAEYALSAENFFELAGQYLTKGGQHSEAYHLVLGAVTLAVLVLGLFFSGERVKKLQKSILWCYGWNVVFIFAAALWESAPGVAVREHLSALGAFQLDRLLWIAPCFWYLAAACGLALCRELFSAKAAGSSRVQRVAGGVSLGISAVAVCVTGLWILVSGDVKNNVQKLRNPDYGMMSLRDYYAVGVMEQVEAYIREKTGMAQEDYRVVSLGIDPAAALYHGFYCLDGYSNNYDLEYKHAFRQVIAPELEKSEYLKGYFDDWGNRCYLFSAETPGYFTIEKDGFYFQDYRVNTEALAALGGDYLLSAAYIADAQDRGLVPLREEPFETTDSYYRIFVYEVKQ